MVWPEPRLLEPSLRCRGVRVDVSAFVRATLASLRRQSSCDFPGCCRSFVLARVIKKKSRVCWSGHVCGTMQTNCRRLTSTYTVGSTATTYGVYGPLEWLNRCHLCRCTLRVVLAALLLILLLFAWKAPLFLRTARCRGVH